MKRSFNVKNHFSMEKEAILRRRCIFAWLCIAIWAFATFAFFYCSAKFLEPSITLDIITPYNCDNYEAEVASLNDAVNKGFFLCLAAVPLYGIAYSLFYVWENNSNKFFPALIGKDSKNN